MDAEHTSYLVIAKMMNKSERMEKMSKAGKFTIDVWDPYPVWCVLRYGDTSIQIRHDELSDLKYAVEKAMQEAYLKLKHCSGVNADEIFICPEKG